MRQINSSTMEEINGGAYNKNTVAGILCGGGAFAFYLLMASNPVTLTAAIYAGSALSGAAVGTCIGLLTTD